MGEGCGPSPAFLSGGTTVTEVDTGKLREKDSVSNLFCDNISTDAHVPIHYLL
jgi:hypothetical protein